MRARLLLLTLAVALPLSAAVALLVVHEAVRARDDAYAETRIVADNVAARLAVKLADIGSVLGRLAQFPSVRAMAAGKCDPVIHDYVRLHPEFTTLAIRDTTGSVICSYIDNPAPQLQPSAFPWLEEGLRSGKFTVGNASLGHQSGKWVSVMTHPVRDEAGRVSGVLILPVELKALGELVLRPIPEHIIVGVIDRERKVLLRSRDDEARVGQPAFARIVEQSRDGTGGRFAEQGVDGVRRLFAYTTLPGTGWRVVAGLSEGDALAGYHRQLAAGLALGIPFLVLVLGTTWWIGSTIAAPIRSLARTATRVAEGHTTARAPEGGPAEIRNVILQFNRMLDAIDRHRADRKAIAGHYEQLLKLARDIVLLFDPEERIVEANDAALAAYGYAAEEIRSLHVRDLWSPESLADVDRQWEASRDPEGTIFESTHRRKDGSTFPVELSARVIEIDGRPYRQSFLRDITARKQVEAALRETESQFRTVVESAPDGIFIQTRGRFAWLNREAARLFGATDARELLGQPVADHFHPDSRELVRERIRLVNEERRAVGEVEETVLRPDGSRLDVETSEVPFTYESDGGALVFVRDMTERKHALERLRGSEHRFRTLVEDVPNIAVQGYDRERRVVFWNAASESLYGFARAEAVGRKLEDLIIPPETREAVVAAVSQWVAGGTPIPAGELTLRDKDGGPVNVFSSHAMLVDHLGNPEMYCIDVDLRPLKRAEAQIVEWKNRYQAAIVASGQLLREWNPETNELSILGDTERILGFRHDELTGGLAQWKELIHPGDREAFDEDFGHAMSARSPFHQRYRVRRKDGAWLSLEDDGYFVLDPSGAVTCMVCFVRDVTERAGAQQRIEAQLDELRRWHAAMLGREARILELKNEVNGLLEASGLLPRYGVAGPEGTQSLA